MRNTNVDTHVPLYSSDKERIRNVFLKHALLVIFEVIYLFDEGDSSAPTRICRFTYPYSIFIPLFILICDNLSILVWQDKSEWCEIVRVSEQLFVLFEYSSEVVLDADHACFGDVAQFLVGGCSSEFA